MNRLVLVVLVLVGAACGESSDPRPAPMRGKTPGNVYGCGELAEAGVSVTGSGLAVGGKPAGCLIDGLACPIARLGLALEACDGGGEAEAECVQNQWRLACVDVSVDAGPSDGAPAHPADAEPTDAPHD